MKLIYEKQIVYVRYGRYEFPRTAATDIHIGRII